MPMVTGFPSTIISVTTFPLVLATTRVFPEVERVGFSKSISMYNLLSFCSIFSAKKNYPLLLLSTRFNLHLHDKNAAGMSGSGTHGADAHSVSCPIFPEEIVRSLNGALRIVVQEPDLFHVILVQFMNTLIHRSFHPLIALIVIHPRILLNHIFQGGNRTLRHKQEIRTPVDGGMSAILEV